MCQVYILLKTKCQDSLKSQFCSASPPPGVDCLLIGLPHPAGWKETSNCLKIDIFKFGKLLQQRMVGFVALHQELKKNQAFFVVQCSLFDFYKKICLLSCLENYYFGWYTWYLQMV